MKKKLRKLMQNPLVTAPGISLFTGPNSTVKRVGATANAGTVTDIYKKKRKKG